MCCRLSELTREPRSPSCAPGARAGRGCVSQVGEFCLWRAPEVCLCPLPLLPCRSSGSSPADSAPGLPWPRGRESRRLSASMVDPLDVSAPRRRRQMTPRTDLVELLCSLILTPGEALSAPISSPTTCCRPCTVADVLGRFPAALALRQLRRSAPLGRRRSCGHLRALRGSRRRGGGRGDAGHSRGC